MKSITRGSILSMTMIAIMMSSCSVDTNTDLQEYVFPSEHSIELLYDTVAIGDGETISLPDVEDEESAWQYIEIVNKSSTDSVVIDDVSIDDATGITLSLDAMESELSPLATGEFKLRYLPDEAGEIERILTIAYRAAERDRSFQVVLKGNRTENTQPLIQVTDANGEELASDDTAYDFGYQASGDIDMMFTIRNTGKDALAIYSVYSSNDTVFKITDRPDSNTSLAADGTAEFTVSLQAAAMDALSDAVITIASNAGNSGEFAFDVAGGGSELPVSVQGTSSYRMDKTNYDFGWVSEETDETITIANESDIVITLDEDAIVVTPATRFSVQSVDGDAIAPGATAELVIRYTPPADEWSEAALTLACDRGRTKTIHLTASTHKLPSDVESLALWLRADRIEEADLTEDGGSYYVDTFPDSAGRNLDAVAVESTRRPRYLESVSDLNDQPAVLFDTVSTSKYLLVDAPAGESIYHDYVNPGVDGGTVFVVCRHTSFPGTRYLLFPVGMTTGGLTTEGGWPEIRTLSTKQYSHRARNNLVSYVFDAEATGSEHYLDDAESQVICWAMDFTNATAGVVKHEFRENGVSLFPSSTTGTYTSDTRNYTDTYNRGLKSLRVGYTSYSIEGYIAEVILFNEYLSESDILEITGYLMCKYGIE